MNEHIIQISKRICELRDILDISASEVAEKVGISLEEYESYESAKDDIPIGVLYAVANVLGVDPTVLLTGDNPRMNDYTVTRKGQGVSVERFEGYKFSSLATNFKDRQMEPMLVTLVPNEHPDLICHGGHEFNYVLSGTVKVTIGSKEIILNEGDSIFFNPEIPHGQSAIGENATFLTVINDF